MLIHIVYDASKEIGDKFDPLAGVVRFVGAKPDGWSYGDSVSLKDLPEDQVSVYLALAAAIQSKGEDWTAVQVWAEMAGERVALRVEAKRDGTGAVRTFTADDDAAFLIEDVRAIEFFKCFSGER